VKISIVPLLLLAGLLAGCQSIRQNFDHPDARWRTEIGQLQYSTPKRSVIGEVVVTSLVNKEFQLDFMAGPGFPIMKLRQSGDMAHAEAAFAHASWSGKTEHAPGKLKPWLALADVFSQLAEANTSKSQVALQSQKPGFWNANATLADGRPLDVTVQFPQSRERFVFHFNR
jgi:hypothetical protein